MPCLLNEPGQVSFCPGVTGFRILTETKVLLMKQNFATIIPGGTGQVGGAVVAELLTIPECREVVIDGTLAESDAAWPLPSPKPAPRGLLVFDFGGLSRFRTMVERDRGSGKRLSSVAQSPKTQEIEWLNNEMP
jgi:hypothetical protein